MTALLAEPETTIAIGTTISDQPVEIRRNPQNPDKFGLFVDEQRQGPGDTFTAQLERAAALVPVHRRAPGIPYPLLEGDRDKPPADTSALERVLDSWLDANPIDAYDVKAQADDHLEVDAWYARGVYAGRYRITLDGKAERIDPAGVARAAADDPGSGTFGRLYRIFDRLRASRPDTYRDDFTSVLTALMDAGPEAANDRLLELLQPPPAPAPEPPPEP